MEKFRKYFKRGKRNMWENEFKYTKETIKLVEKGVKDRNKTRINRNDNHI